MHTTEWDREALQATLKAIMKRANLTQTAIGQIAGRDRTMANRWMGGKSRPTYEAATALASYIGEQHPDLAEQLLAAAGYGSHDRSPPAWSEQEPANSPKEVVEELREIARKEDKSIGDVLVERGLATPEELTLSEEKQADRYVRDILESNLPEETKNRALMEYAVRRRRHFRNEGLIGKAEEM